MGVAEGVIIPIIMIAHIRKRNVKSLAVQVCSIGVTIELMTIPGISGMEVPLIDMLRANQNR